MKLSTIVYLICMATGSVVCHILGYEITSWPWWVFMALLVVSHLSGKIAHYQEQGGS